MTAHPMDVNITSRVTTPFLVLCNNHWLAAKNLTDAEYFVSTIDPVDLAYSFSVVNERTTQ